MLNIAAKFLPSWNMTLIPITKTKQVVLLTEIRLLNSRFFNMLMHGDLKGVICFITRMMPSLFTFVKQFVISSLVNILLNDLPFETYIASIFVYMT